MFLTSTVSCRSFPRPSVLRAAVARLFQRNKFQRRVAALSAQSDAELARLGLTRDQIPAYVMGLPRSAR